MRSERNGQSPDKATVFKAGMEIRTDKVDDLVWTLFILLPKMDKVQMRPCLDSVHFFQTACGLVWTLSISFQDGQGPE